MNDRREQNRMSVAPPVQNEFIVEKHFQDLYAVCRKYGFSFESASNGEIIIHHDNGKGRKESFNGGDTQKSIALLVKSYPLN